MGFGLLLALSSLIAPVRSGSAEPVWKVRSEDGRFWFVSPEKKRMWSLAVDVTDTGAPGTQENPAYNALELYPSKLAWAVDTAKRYQTWGINSLGGWSDHAAFAEAGRPLPYIEVLHLGSYNKAPWNDLYAPETEKYLSDAASTLIRPLRNDPDLIGYCTDNELGWWDDSLFKWYFKFDGKAPGKRKLVQDLKRLYRGDFEAFRSDWIVKSRTFDELADEPRAFLRPGRKGIRAVIDFNQKLAERYYAMVYRLVRREDPNRLLLGDRYAQYYNLETVRASKPYIDVVTSNAGADWLDGTYSKFFFRNLNRMTGKPVLITEFYFAARENRSGNRNSGEYFPTVQTQEQRAKGFGSCIRDLASQPWVVGAHWFQYYDEPSKGRGDGEDYNHGLVDLKGQPYDGMIGALKGLNVEQIHRDGPPATVPGVPVAPDNPMADHLLYWDRNRAYVPSESAEQWADLYVAYDAKNLYVGLCAMEFIDESLYEDGKIPEVDRPRLDLQIGRWRGAVRFGGDKRAAIAGPGIAEVAERPGLKHMLVLKIPAENLGTKGFARGDQASVSATLRSHARGFAMRWNKKVKLN